MRECRPCRAHCRIGCVSPGFHIGLCPHSTLGFAGVPPLQGSLSYWAFAVLCRGIVFVVFIPLGHLFAWLSAALAGLIARFCCLPRVSYRALPSFHPGLCGSVALAGLFVVLGVCGVVSWYCVR